MALFEIKSWIDGKILFSLECASLKICVEAAVKAKADLGYADLRSANLRSANLTSANLSSADLRSADLRSANLASANLSKETILDTQETWHEYISDVVPALLQAGGKALADLKESFNCHSWDNCPIAVALNIHSSDDAPPLLKPRVRQFVNWFDAGCIKWEMIAPKAQ